MINRRTAVAFLCALLSTTLTFAARYEPLPVFTKEFVRTEGVTRIPLHVDTGGKAYPDTWSVRGGIPLPKGELASTDAVRVLNAEGKATSFQVRPLAWWEAAKSIKWLEVQFSIPARSVDPTYALEYGAKVSPASTAEPIHLRESGDEVVVDTGRLRARISKRRGSLLEAVSVGTAGGQWNPLSGPISSTITLRDTEGDRSGVYNTLADKAPQITVERHGPESVTVLVQAWHKRDDGRQTFPVDVRLTFYRDQPRIKITHTFYVSENTAVVLFPALGLDIPLAVGGNVTTGVDGQAVSVPGDSLALWQDSTETPLYPKCDQFAPFCKLFADGNRRATPFHKGEKSDGWIRLGGGDKAVTVTLRRLWQEFPKGLRLSDGRLRVEFWPEIKPQPMDLRRIDQRFPDDYNHFKIGEGRNIRGYEYNMKVYHRCMTKERELRCSALGIGKSHEVWLDFSAPTVPAPALAQAADRPLLPFVTPAWNRYTNALGAFHPEDRKNFPTIEAAWEFAWDTLMKHQREWFNWYGMFNWGDFQTDYFPAEKRWGYYNTKYGWRNGGMDIPYSIHLWYLRTGKRKYFDLADIASRHLMDICSGHPRAWSDERLVPKTWSGGGGSRYDKNHWGSGRGYDPQHCFAHSIQAHWLVTGETHTRDVITEYAENYYRRDKPFNYWKSTGKRMHYHGRVSDMVARLVAIAYENDPLDPRWNEMLDYYLGHQAEGLRSMYIDEAGHVRRRCTKVDVMPFYYTLYKSAALNFLLTVKDCPELVAACKQGFPLRYQDESASGAGITFHLLYLLTGNRNYAEYAARQAAQHVGAFKSHGKPSMDMGLIPHVMGGTWSCYPALLEAVVKADLELSPEQYDGRELDYYPVAEPGPDSKDPGNRVGFDPVDIRPVCNWCAYSDDGKAPQGESAVVNTDPAAGPVRFDFGPLDTLAPAVLAVTSASHYPVTIETREKGFSALPFGSCAQFNSVPFCLLPHRANDGKGMLVVEDKQTYMIPVDRRARKLYVLTGVSLGGDPFHEGAGAEVRVTFADDTAKTFPLVNMVHYQMNGLNRLYFSRRFHAGRLNRFNISVVDLDTQGKRVKSLSIADTGKGARVCIFAITAERVEPTTITPLHEEAVNQASAEYVSYEKTLPNGRYEVAARVSPGGTLGSTLDIYTQDRLTVNHTVPVAATTYVLPATVTDGRLRLKLLPGEIHHKSRAGEGEVRLETLRVRPRRLPEWMGPAEQGSSAAPALTYGWRLRGPRAVVRDRLASTYRESDEQSRDPAILLNHDCCLMDGYGIGRAEFVIDIANGRYEVELVLIGTNHAESRATARFEGETVQMELVRNKQINVHQFLPSLKTLKQTVTVTDGRLNLSVAMPPKGVRKMGEGFGICSVTLRTLK